MLHHLSLPVADLDAASTLYDALMGALGFRRVFTTRDAVGYGIEDGKDKLCLKQQASARAAGPGFHLAFSASSRAAVDQFHRAAIAHGARDNGPPGLRSYGADYYATFVIDPDGHRLEAVHKPA